MYSSCDSDVWVLGWRTWESYKLTQELKRDPRVCEVHLPNLHLEESTLALLDRAHSPQGYVKLSKGARMIAVNSRI